ncbi:hypothetical protein OJF2_34470 [Aquisphaera giovannonii]|uniref:DUF1871 domain-containing protein n=1 Tax=Aquisphaera giovannonii TaxID=406548 RepID=A0A5B9W2U0_9BACT|nr:hypothetical protein [Aquisphaera giovannonii]QEH34902.1 hypothetical protein OJF2_34470 [Aquisphaera giovannonii]
MAGVKHLMEAVRQVLLREWDPIGVADNPACFDEYDRYARTICRYLEEGVDEFKLTAYLGQVQTVGMGLSRADAERDKLVARRLMALSV